jgi:hypothetical protein
MTQARLRLHLRRMPLRYLRELAADVEALVLELESTKVRREIDIASEHQGNKDLIHSVVKTIGDMSTGRWRQVENIYCCLEHCPRCPHGEFIFQYRRNIRKATVSVNFGGMPALPNDILEMSLSEIRDPVPYSVSVASDIVADHPSPRKDV